MDAGQSSRLLNQKAVASMDHFMDGRIEYYLEVPTVLRDHEYVLRPLMLLSEGFSKHSRPSAWKGSDLKIQSTLPLLGMPKTDNNKDDDKGSSRQNAGSSSKTNKKNHQSDVLESLANFEIKPENNPVRLVKVTLSLVNEES